MATTNRFALLGKNDRNDLRQPKKEPLPPAQAPDQPQSVGEGKTKAGRRRGRGGKHDRGGRRSQNKNGEAGNEESPRRPFEHRSAATWGIYCFVKYCFFFFFQSLSYLFKYEVKQGSSEEKEPEEYKTPVSINEFLKPAEGERYYGGGGRRGVVCHAHGGGRARPGGARGGRRGGPEIQGYKWKSPPKTQDEVLGQSPKNRRS